MTAQLGPLAQSILTALRDRGDTVLCLRDIAHLSDRATRRDKERHVDQTLQRLRRAGLITYDRRAGWSAVAPTKSHQLDLDQQLAALKAHPGFAEVMHCLRTDREQWAIDDCLAAFDLLLELLREAP